jgi:hypothetical protein
MLGERLRASRRKILGRFSRRLSGAPLRRSTWHGNGKLFLPCGELRFPFCARRSMMVITVVYARGAARRPGRVNVAHRAFAQGPESAQAFEFERGEIENRMARASAARECPRCSITTFISIRGAPTAGEGLCRGFFSLWTRPSRQENDRRAACGVRARRCTPSNSLLPLLGIERQAHRAHLGIQIVQIMQQQRFAEHGSLGEPNSYWP